jgi:hypothetical protein
MARFPKTLYVKHERHEGEDRYAADTDADCLVEWHPVKIATYQLVEVREGQAVVQFNKKESSNG